jgi:serine protease inhibitor ecotin
MTEKNVIIGYNRSLVRRFLLEKDIFKALVTADEWTRLSASTEIVERYTPYPSAENSFYLLVLQSSCGDEQCVPPVQ